MLLRKAVVLLLGVVALMVVAGCAGRKDTAPSAAVPPPMNVAGTWTGEMGVGGPPVTMMLQQTGADVKGDLRVAGRADVSGPIQGKVEGNTIKLTSSGGTAPTLNVQGDRITGYVRGANLDLRRTK
jgi:hypothetical protein